MKLVMDEEWMTIPLLQWKHYTVTIKDNTTKMSNKQIESWVIMKPINEICSAMSWWTLETTNF